MNNDKLLDWYYLLALGRLLDQKAPNYLKQALGWSYHAPYAGHDGIQLALGQVFEKKKDHLFPYYRDLLTVLSAGLTPLEILLNGLSKKMMLPVVVDICLIILQNPNGIFITLLLVQETMPCMLWV